MRVGGILAVLGSVLQMLGVPLAWTRKKHWQVVVERHGVMHILVDDDTKTFDTVDRIILAAESVQEDLLQ